MKLQPQIDAIEDLARIDADLNARVTELEKERESLDQKRAQLRALDDKNQGTNASMDDMERTRNELVQEARQMSVQLERSREKMSRCRTERELNAAQREVEELRKLFRDREIEIGKLTALIQQAQEDVDATVQEREELAGSLGSTEADATTRMQELEQELSKFVEQRKDVAKKLPVPLFRRYEMILKRKGSALAHSGDGMCNACHIMLPPMMFQQLQRGEDFDQCPNCHRIIYFRPPTEEGESSGER